MSIHAPLRAPVSLWDLGGRRTIGWQAPLLVLACWACDTPRATEPTPHAAPQHQDKEAPHEELPSRVRLPDAVLRAARIQTAAAAPARLPATVELPGEIAADPDRSARVTARLPGRITEVHFKEGGRVAAGALLAVLESTELARARAAFVSSQARSQAAQKNAARLESLSRSGLAAAQDVVAALAEARSQQAEADAAERALRAYGLSSEELLRPGARSELRAPIAGFAVSRSAVIGQTVSADHVLTDLVDLERAYFVGRLFEKHLSRVHVGEAAEVRLNAYPRKLFVGTVESIGKQLDPTARTVVARIAIANQEDLLKVGLFGTAKVSIPLPGTAPGATPDAAPDALAIPLRAVTRLTGKDVVFVKQADGDFEVHPVTLGGSAGGLVEVLSGLRAGEQVVTEGVFTLKSAVLKHTFGSED